MWKFKAKVAAMQQGRVNASYVVSIPARASKQIKELVGDRRVTALGRRQRQAHRAFQPLQSVTMVQT